MLKGSFPPVFHGRSLRRGFVFLGRRERRARLGARFGEGRKVPSPGRCRRDGHGPLVELDEISEGNLLDIT